MPIGWTRPRFTSPPLDEPFEVNWASPQAQGLAAWWPTLSGRGNVLMDRVLGLSGSLLAGTTWAGDGSLGASLAYTAVKGISVAATPCLDILETLTVMGWVNLSSLRNNAVAQTIVARCTTYFPYTSIQWRLVRPAYGTFFRFLVSNDVAQFGADSPTFALNTTVHAAATYNKGTLTNYRNAVPGTPNAAGPTSLISHSFAIQIGTASTAGIDIWYGRIGDVRIYRTALPPATIYQAYDPATRWDLYQPVVRWWAVGEVAVGVPRINPSLATVTPGGGVPAVGPHAGGVP